MATARDPFAAVQTVATPQTQRLPGRNDQVRNAAGGYVFDKGLWTKVEDFLILGTTGGTYYVSQDKLTSANVDVINQAVAADGRRLVSLIVDIQASQPPRAPKPRAAIFALAVAAAKGDPATVQAVKTAFPLVIRTTDHLAMFFGYWKAHAGKTVQGRGTAPVIGRAMRTTFGSFFTGEDLHSVAYRALKARQRSTPQGEAMALRDVLRIAHPKAADGERKALFGWLAGNVTDDVARAAVADVDNFLAAQSVTSPAEALQVIRERRVPWEFLPSEVLSDKDVWAELAGTVGLTALIRNLARMTRIGAIGPFSPVNELVAARLTHAGNLARARVHPMDLFLALKVYQSGQSNPTIGSRYDPAKTQTWAPEGVIVDALAQAYELSFGHIEPSGKRLLVAVDCSGSMGGGVYSGGTLLGSAYHVGTAMSVMLARTEGGNAHFIDFGTQVHASRVTPRVSLSQIDSWIMPGGGTNLSLPMIYAAGGAGAGYHRSGAAQLKVDGIVIFTDNETWAGYNHPVQALSDYRRQVNPDVRVVVCSMTATGYSIMDPKDEGVLQVAGLDSSLPKLITGFIR